MDNNDKTNPVLDTDDIMNMMNMGGNFLDNLPEIKKPVSGAGTAGGINAYDQSYDAPLPPLPEAPAAPAAPAYDGGYANETAPAYSDSYQTTAAPVYGQDYSTDTAVSYDSGYSNTDNTSYGGYQAETSPAYGQGYEAESTPAYESGYDPQAAPAYDGSYQSPDPQPYEQNFPTQTTPAYSRGRVYRTSGSAEFDEPYETQQSYEPQAAEPEPELQPEPEPEQNSRAYAPLTNDDMLLNKPASPDFDFELPDLPLPASVPKKQPPKPVPRDDMKTDFMPEFEAAPAPAPRRKKPAAPLGGMGVMDDIMAEGAKGDESKLDKQIEKYDTTTDMDSLTPELSEMDGAAFNVKKNKEKISVKQLTPKELADQEFEMIASGNNINPRDYEVPDGGAKPPVAAIVGGIAALAAVGVAILFFIQ